jgi:RNA polymerase sigma-70 factor (ECF subfamily)
MELSSLTGGGDPGKERWLHLIGRVAAADQAALEEIYDSTSSMVYGLILRIVGHSQAAEEVTLDVYTQVWRQAKAFDPSRGSFLSWLFLLARSRGLDFVRSKAHTTQRRQEPLEDSAHFVDDSPTPLEDRILSARRETVRAAVASLPTEQRAAIELAFFSGLSHTEIAGRLGHPLGTVKTRIRTGMMKLREMLEPVAEEL